MLNLSLRPPGLSVSGGFQISGIVFSVRFRTRAFEPLMIMN